MANTFTVTRVEQGTKQFQGAFSDMWAVTGTVGDQDAIADDVSVTLTLTNVDDAADAYDADTLTGGEFKMLIGRPSW